MKHFHGMITVALVLAAFAAAVAPAEAGGWRHRRAYPSLDMNQGGVRYYNPPVRYYNVCGYGDCICLMNRALATGSQVWWDRYQACTGS